MQSPKNIATLIYKSAAFKQSSGIQLAPRISLELCTEE